MTEKLILISPSLSSSPLKIATAERIKNTARDLLSGALQEAIRKDEDEEPRPQSDSDIEPASEEEGPPVTDLGSGLLLPTLEEQNQVKDRITSRLCVDSIAVLKRVQVSLYAVMGPILFFVLFSSKNFPYSFLKRFGHLLNFYLAKYVDQKLAILIAHVLLILKK